MKKCPACQSTYSDETLLYCLQDGVPLEDATSETIEAETVLRPHAPVQLTVPISDSSEERIEANAGSGPAAAEHSSGTRTLITILTTVLIMLLLFGVLGVSGYLYLNRDVQTQTPGNESNTNQIVRSRSPENVADTPLAQNTPKPSQTPQTPTPSPTSTPDLADLKRRVSEKVYAWTALARARNLNAYMDMYGKRIDYYNKRGATKEFVRGDKSKAFTKYDKLEIVLSNMNVTPLKDGLVAAEFDKAFNFTAPSEAVSGKVRSRLVFRESGGELKIVSERDMKVYYVNK
ncbi:MAG: hypothetical protein OEM82_10930 [Acidobacteriota bacterium]|nr:hypothetical protein [Acidobacteriota bacterium]MDH3529318.1 hypothetical protein [Acidobacteriota bacterium]